MNQNDYENIFKLWDENAHISISSGLEKQYEVEENMSNLDYKIAK